MCGILITVFYILLYNTVFWRIGVETRSLLEKNLINIVVLDRCLIYRSLCHVEIKCQLDAKEVFIADIIA